MVLLTLKKNLRIACDLEGVLAGSNVMFPQVVAEMFGVEVPFSFQYQWNLMETAKYALGIDLTPELHEKLWEEVWKRWEEISAIEKSSRLILQHLQMLGHDVTILTHSFNSRIEEEKERWIRRHFPPSIKIEWVNGAKRKEDYDFDLFIDDGPHNIVSLHRLGRPVICFTQPWNLGVGDDWYLARVSSLKGVLLLLMGAQVAPVRFLSHGDTEAGQ
jgi:5'(3')-deoxyribonucleotidase